MQFNDPIIGRSNKFAKHSLLIRIPSILKAASEQLNIKLHSSEISKLETLIHDITNNVEPSPIQDSMVDCDEWNLQLAKLKNSQETFRYLDIPWLFSECYIYRRLQSIVEKTQVDVFAEEKLKALRHTLDKYIDSTNLPVVKDQLLKVLMGSLWGNQMDLSLHVNMKSMPTHVNSNDNLILNDVEALWKDISTVHAGTIHIVLDNVASEFLNDLLMADFFVEQGIAFEVIFHCKSFPWFVSDVTLKDVDIMFEKLIEHPLLKVKAQKWLSWRDDVFFFKENPFWTMHYWYGELKEKNVGLYNEFKNADLVIFKGDLNYRKLTNDSLSPNIPEIGFRSLAIRTCKSDTLVGVSSTKREKLDKVDANWQVNGKFGLIQYFKK